MTPLTDEELLALITDMESDRAERKRAWKGDAPEKGRQAVCAFANDLPNHGKPGVLFIGVEDSGAPTGMDFVVTDELLQTLADIKTDYTARQQGDIARSLTQLFEAFLPHIPAGRLPVWAGSSGVEPATAEDLAFLDLLSAYDIAPDVRIYGDDLGYSVEAHFFAGLALAALTTSSEGQRKSREPKAARHALVTGTGYWRSEALALIEAIG